MLNCLAIVGRLPIEPSRFSRMRGKGTMTGIPEARRKWLAERLRQVAAEERDEDVAASFRGLAADVEAGRTRENGEEE